MHFVVFIIGFSFSKLCRSIENGTVTMLDMQMIGGFIRFMRVHDYCSILVSLYIVKCDC